MDSKKSSPLIINSIDEQHSLLGINKPDHPLCSIIEFDEIIMDTIAAPITFINEFYTITLKSKCTSNEKYGRNMHDFDQGLMNFCAPNLIRELDGNDSFPKNGWMLSFHPDFLINHPLKEKITENGYFYYNKNEALHLSSKEEKIIVRLFNAIRQEYQSNIDSFSQDIILSEIGTLLSYATRFYNRQSITRKSLNNNLVKKLDVILDKYIEQDLLEKNGIPSVKYISEEMNISSNYLSDILRNLTGQNTQQHVQNKIITRAKHLLITTHLSVSEVAYKLGFQQPQSFNKLFKIKTKITPLEFKSSYN